MIFRRMALQAMDIPAVMSPAARVRLARAL
jgi:hypothetical protein